MRNFFSFFLLSILFISCGKEDKYTIDVSEISVDFTVDRFEIDFYNSNKTNLEKLKTKYPFLFPENTPDSIWISKIQNKDEQDLFLESQKVFKDFSSTNKDLENLFKHIKYYNTSFKEPNVVTVLSNLDYNYKIIYSDLLLIISLDLYLGSNHVFYNDYPNYIRHNNTKERIVVDVANQFIERQIKLSNNRTFLGKMIAAGKKLHLLDLYLPNVPDNLKIGYSKEKLLWSQANEEQVWKYFIENKLLYSTDTKLNKRFLDEAPFSKFYLSEDVKSPGRIGQWLGWQIVRSFMEKNDVSLQTLLEMNEDEIFKKSNYKPRK